MRRFRRALVLAVAAAGLCLAPALAKPAWDQASNIKDAAKRLAVLHRTQGSEGVVKFLDACYKTHTIASAFTAGLEACMAQDYMHSRVLAEIYTKLPEEARAKLRAPSAEFIANTMNARFATIMAQYKLSSGDGEALRKSFDTYGMPVFIKAAFPPRKRNSADDGKREKN